MLIAGWLETADTWLVQNVPHAEWLGLFGAAMAVLALLYVTVRVLFALRRFAGAAMNFSRARTAKASKAPGFRILLARPDGASSGRINKWLSEALARNLPVFAFGAPFSLVSMGRIKGGLGTASVARARKRMATADADLFVSGASSFGFGGFSPSSTVPAGGMVSQDVTVLSFSGACTGSETFTYQATGLVCTDPPALQASFNIAGSSFCFCS